MTIIKQELQKYQIPFNRFKKEDYGKQSYYQKYHSNDKKAPIKQLNVAPDWLSYDSQSQCFVPKNPTYFLNKYGGHKIPAYLPVDPGYDYLMNYEVYCLLLGIILSDGSIDKEGRMTFEQTVRIESNFITFVALLFKLAPIITSITIDTKKTLANDQSLDLSNCIIKNTNELDILACQKRVKELINALSNTADQKVFNTRAEYDTYINETRGRTQVGFNVRFYTRSIFKNWRTIFYSYNNATQAAQTLFNKEGKAPKVFTPQIKEAFTSPISLATAIMCDGAGGNDHDKATRLSIGSLCAETFMSALKENFCLETTLRLENANAYNQRISISTLATKNDKKKSNMHLARYMLQPYLHDSVQYKLYLGLNSAKNPFLLQNNLLSEETSEKPSEEPLEALSEETSKEPLEALSEETSEETSKEPSIVSAFKKLNLDKPTFNSVPGSFYNDFNVQTLKENFPYIQDVVFPLIWDCYDLSVHSQYNTEKRISPNKETAIKNYSNFMLAIKTFLKNS